MVRKRGPETHRAIDGERAFNAGQLPEELLTTANFTLNGHSFQPKSFKMYLFLVKKW